MPSKTIRRAYEPRLKSSCEYWAMNGCSFGLAMIISRGGTVEHLALSIIELEFHRSYFICKQQLLPVEEYERGEPPPRPPGLTNIPQEDCEKDLIDRIQEVTGEELKEVKKAVKRLVDRIHENCNQKEAKPWQMETQ